MRKFLKTSLAAVAATTILSGTAMADNFDNTFAPEMGNFAEAALYSAVHPFSKPKGTEDFSCRGTGNKTTPVILIHGTNANSVTSWSRFAPRIKEAGYCVFAPNIGVSKKSLIAALPAFANMADIRETAQELKEYVEKVKKGTGASKVDLVGYSLGAGLVPRWYMSKLGGQDSVRKFVGIAPSNYGTTMSGLGYVARALKLEGLIDVIADKSPAQQLYGSEIVKELEANKNEFNNNVEYITIHSKFDEVLTPVADAQFLKTERAKKILIQDLCNQDFSDHLSISYSENVLQVVLNELGSEFNKNKTTPITCKLSFPFL